MPATYLDDIAVDTVTAVLETDVQVLSVISPEIVVVEDELVTVIQEGALGPPGPPGPQGVQGDIGSVAVTKIAAITLSGHRIVLLDEFGKANYASNAFLDHANRVFGLTTQAALQGETVTVQMVSDVVEPSWNWDVSKPVYLGDNGLLTQEIPQAPSAKFVLVVGVPTSPTSLFLNVGIPITLI